MIVYIHLQPVEYVDAVYAMTALMRLYNLTGVYQDITPAHYPAGEYLYKYTAGTEDGRKLQNFIEWISTRRYCKDISVQ